MSFIKNKFLLLTVLIPALTLPVPSLASTPDDTGTLNEVKQETRELVDALKSYTYEQKEQALNNIEVTLDNLDREIDALEKRIDKNWDQMKQKTREESRALLAKLRKQRIKVAETYGSLKNSSVNAWGHMREGFSNAYTTLQKAWENALKEY